MISEKGAKQLRERTFIETHPNGCLLLGFDVEATLFDILWRGVASQCTQFEGFSFDFVPLQKKAIAAS